MPTPCLLDADQARWVDQLVATFTRHAQTRMAGLPVCHPGLHVQAVGFQPWAGTEGMGPGLLGVLITPWFMNLVWRPDADAADAAAAPQAGLPTWPVGQQRDLKPGADPLTFTGAHEPELGPYAACSLISPLFQFADQAAAVATAQVVMDTLRAEAQAVREKQAQAEARAQATAPAQPSRRGFLLGRSAAAGLQDGRPTTATGAAR